MIPRFFGNSNHELFGIVHPARGRNQSHNEFKHSVLICPPIGHEYLRTHWAIRSLASRLAREGMHVLRFDYLGVGDSDQDVAEVQSLQQWVDDTSEAAVELMEEVGDLDCPLTIIGLRWGAVMATRAASEMAENQIPANLILWEPATNGTEYLAGLREMHQQMIDLWVSKVATENSQTHEEILGFRYSRSLLEDIEQTDLAREPRPNADNVIALTSERDSRLSEWNLSGSSHIAKTQDTYDWNDLNFIEEAWLPTSSPAQILRGLKQFHEQLQQPKRNRGVVVCEQYENGLEAAFGVPTA